MHVAETADAAAEGGPVRDAVAAAIDGRKSLAAASSVLRFLASIAVAAIVAWKVIQGLPTKVSAHTDVVGYPTYANFNVEAYFQTYWVVVLLFPLVALLVFLALTFVARRVGLAPRIDAAPAARPIATESAAALPAVRQLLLQAGRLVVVGAALATEVAVARASSPLDYGKTLVVGIGLYALVVFSATLSWHLFRRERRAWTSRIALLNTMLAPLTVFGLLGASVASRVSVISTGEVRSFHWLPIWVAALGFVIALIAVGGLLYRARTDSDVAKLERNVVLVIAGSVAMFLVVASMPAELGWFSVFEEGQGLASVRLAIHGFFPWRDFFAAHGLLEDTLRPLFGSIVFEASRWGSVAGYTMVLYPLYVIFLYLLFVYLFRDKWPLLVSSCLVLLSANVGPPNFRFILWPIVLLLLAAVLTKPSLVRSCAFVVLLLAQAILVPESIFAVPACGVIIVLYEVFHFDRGRSMLQNFRRTIACSVAGLAVLATFFGFLASHGALRSFFFYYRIAAETRSLAGGIRFEDFLAVSKQAGLDQFAAIVPPATILISFWYVAARLWRRTRFEPADWVMGAVAIFVFFYYEKFLSRADSHVYQPYTMAVPLLLYIVYRVVRAVEKWLQERRVGGILARYVTRNPVGLVLLAVFVLNIPGLTARMMQLPHQYQATVSQPAWQPSLGYATPDGLDRGLYADLNQVLSAYVRPGDQIFDFANEPGIYYYLFNYWPSTRYYIVNLQMARDAQADLLVGLRQTRPKLVVFNDTLLGVPAMDGIPNMVRHYDISQYILDNYRPLAMVDGQMLFVDKNVSVPPPSSLGLRLTQPLVTDNLLFRAQQCDWGYEPNFFSVTPSESGNRAPLTLTTRRAMVPTATRQAPALELHLPPGAHWTDYQWIEIETASSFHDDSFALYDRVSTNEDREIQFKTTNDSPKRYLVRVGSCAQWHGYAADTLLLRHSNPEDITAVRLIP